MDDILSVNCKEITFLVNQIQPIEVITIEPTLTQSIMLAHERGTSGVRKTRK